MRGQSLNPLLLQSLLVASAVLAQLACLPVEAREMPVLHEAPSTTTPLELQPTELTPTTTITPDQPPMAESIPPPEMVRQLSNPSPEAVASLSIPDFPTPDASDSADSAPTAAAVAAAAAAGVVVEAVPVCTIPEGLAIVDIPLPPREPDTATATATPELPASAEATATTPMAIVAPPALYAANLQAHNAYRAMHASTGALSWDTVVAASAVARAEKCIWDHEPNIPYGENLYASSVYSDAARQQLDGIKGWYREVALYGYNAPGFSVFTGHFTQIVWTTSTLLGCAVQSCPKGLVGWSAGRFLMVCRYSPPGNYLGQFGTKVKPVLATTLAQATIITSDSCKASPNNVYSLCQRTNGRLELMKSGSANPLWRSTTTTLTTGTYKLTVETTGMLTVKTSAGVAKWSSNAANPSGKVGPYRLLVQNNGNVQLVDSRSALVWQTNTVQ